MPVNRIPKPTIAASDAELERQYISGDGWQTVEVETPTGGGCQFLACEGDLALLEAHNIFINGQEETPGIGSNVYLFAQDTDGHSRAGVEGNLSGDHSSVVLAASSADSLLTSGLFLDVEVESTATLRADKIGFAASIAITRPELDLGSPTLAADVASALAALGLVTLA